MKKMNVSKTRLSLYLSFLFILIRCLILCYICRLMRKKYSLLRTCSVRNSRLLSGPSKNGFFGSFNSNNLINELEENLRDEWDIAVDNILRGDDTSTFHDNTSRSENSNYLSINVIHHIHRGADTNIIEENDMVSVTEIVDSLHDSNEIDNIHNVDIINNMNDDHYQNVDYCNLSTCSTECSLSYHNTENYNASSNSSDDNVNDDFASDHSRNVERIQNTYNFFIIHPNTCHNLYPLMINIFNENGERCDYYPSIRNMVDHSEMENIMNKSREDMNALYEYTLIRFPDYKKDKYMCSSYEDILYERNFLEELELLKNKSHDMFIVIHFRLRKGIECTDNLSIFSFDNNYGYGYYYVNHSSIDGDQDNSRDMNNERSSLKKDVNDSFSHGSGNYTSENKGRDRESTNICMNDRCPYDYYNIFDRDYTGNRENLLDHSEKEVDPSKCDKNKDKDKNENKQNDSTESKEENEDDNKDTNEDKKEVNENELNNKSGNEIEVCNRTNTTFDNNEENENGMITARSDTNTRELNVPSDMREVDDFFLWSDSSSESSSNYDNDSNLAQTHYQESSDTSTEIDMLPEYVPDLIVMESSTDTSETDSSYMTSQYDYRREEIDDTTENPYIDYDDLYSSTDSYVTVSSDVSSTSTENEDGVTSTTISEYEDTAIISSSESSESSADDSEEEESLNNNTVSYLNGDSNFKTYHVEIIYNDTDVNLLHHFIDYNGYRDKTRRKNLDSLLKALENLPKKDKSLNVWIYGLKVSLAIIEYVSNEILALSEVIRDDFECNRGDCNDDGCKWCMAHSKFNIDLLTLHFFMGSKRSNPNLSYKYLTCKEFIITRFKKLVYDSIDAIETYVAIVECFLLESIFDRIKDS
ncbi:Plasmodium exported protein, unknown function [Plasmodium sp. DRC-Itaito]|nr:Plasmodium exported protein, unknown function [Plasmodium sp. DRC-Itaito]